MENEKSAVAAIFLSQHVSVIRKVQHEHAEDDENDFSAGKILFILLILRIQSCKLYNNKNMIASTQITNTEILAFIAVLAFKLFSIKFCLKTEKTIRTLKKQATF